MRTQSWPAVGVAALGATGVVLLAFDVPVSIIVARATWVAAALTVTLDDDRSRTGRLLTATGVVLAAICVVTWTVWVLGAD